jgi:hypothetical protein
MLPMTIIEFGLIAILWCAASATSSGTDVGRCVPKDVDLNSLVVSEVSKPTHKSIANQVTVKQRLNQLKARCKRGKLVDGKNRPIYLYPMIGCWGNPPDNYLDMLRQQDEEIQRLKKKYVVIQISCAQGDPRMISQNSR